MELTVSNKTLDTSQIKNLLRQGEANVDSPVIVLDKTYNGIDISGYTFTLRAASNKNTLVSRVLQKEVLTDKIRLTWEVVPEYTAVPGSLHITIVGTSATGEDIIKITADAINVLSDPSSWSAPSPDVVADAINQMTAILVDATAEANRAAAEADRLIDVGVRFRVMGAYDTLAALQAAVTAPAVGDAYQVGTTDVDRVIYLWDGTTWVNMGAIQGTQGPPGPQGQPGEAGPKGDPSTVCGKAADASGNIVLDTTDLLMTGYTKPTSGGDIAGTDTLMQAVQRLAYNVGLLSNPNLLINWDFRNPVNQRGQTNYLGAVYTIDCWKLYQSQCAMTINPGYISISRSSGNFYTFLQNIENPSALASKTVTFSMHIKHTVDSGYLRIVDGGTSLASTSVDAGFSGIASVTVKLPDTITGPLWVAFYQQGINSETQLYSAKLEIGLISTLANDQPVNYGEQLALCQRYQYQNIGETTFRMEHYTASNMSFIVPTSTSMRAAPTFSENPTVYNMQGQAQSGFTFAYQLRNGFIRIFATKAAHGLTDGYLLLPIGTFDANL